MFWKSLQFKEKATRWPLSAVRCSWRRLDPVTGLTQQCSLLFRCWSMKKYTKCIFTDFWLYEWGIPGWGMLNVKNEAVIWRAACCVLMCEQTPPGAAVHCEITAWTGSGDLNSNNTHTELPYYGAAGTPADCLMIPHPPRIEVTETLIQDSLIIASVSFYLHLLKHYLCACFILHFHPYLYPSLSCKASPDTLLTFKAKISL